MRKFAFQIPPAIIDQLSQTLALSATYLPAVWLGGRLANYYIQSRPELTFDAGKSYVVKRYKQLLRKYQKETGVPWSELYQYHKIQNKSDQTQATYSVPGAVTERWPKGIITPEIERLIDQAIKVDPTLNKRLIIGLVNPTLREVLEQELNEKSTVSQINLQTASGEKLYKKLIHGKGSIEKYLHPKRLKGQKLEALHHTEDVLNYAEGGPHAYVERRAVVIAPTEHPAVVAHELGHLIHENKLDFIPGMSILRTIGRYTPFISFPAAFLTQKLTGSTPLGLAVLWAAHLPTIASEVAASRVGQKLIREAGLGEEYKAYVGLPTYLIHPIAASIAYFAHKPVKVLIDRMLNKYL